MKYLVVLLFAVMAVKSVSGPLFSPGQVFYSLGWLMLFLFYPQLIQPVGDRWNLYLRMYAP